MNAECITPESLQEAIRYFADVERTFEYMKAIRWPSGVVSCPRCGSDKVSFISTRKLWTCKECTTKKQFTIKVGTVMEDSPIGFDKWLLAFWQVANCKNGVSSYELGKAIDVTQRTAWFMLQRIRLALQQGSIMKMGGTVEVDETWIGGAARKMNAKQRAKRARNGPGPWNLNPVQGLLERGTRKKASRVKLQHIPNTNRATLQQNVREYVLKGSEVMTDEHRSYNGLNDEYTHQVINHAECYAKGTVHTNGLENFWSLLKRMLKGTYVSVEPYHLFRYLDEQAFRFNERKDEDGDKGRFLKALAGIFGKRLTWDKLTGKDGVAPADGLMFA